MTLLFSVPSLWKNLCLSTSSPALVSPNQNTALVSPEELLDEHKRIVLEGSKGSKQ